MFKDQEPMKNKTISKWEANKKLKKFMVETIQQMQATTPPLEAPFTLVGEWFTSWTKMPSSIDLAKPSKLQEVPSMFISKIIFVVDTFDDINKLMWETNYTLIFNNCSRLHLN